MRFLSSLGSFLRAFSLMVGNSVILLVLTLLILEWWARLVAPIPPETTAITVNNQYYAYHPWAGYRNTPGFRYELGNWVPTVVNSWGWRGPEPTVARNKSVRRAMLFGDSVTFSCWGCREEASFGGSLKRALELRTNEEWEVINTSVGGGFSSISLGTLAHDAIQFRPDLVVTLNGINDVLVLDDRTMLHMGAGLFKHSIYHQGQIDTFKIFDQRTGRVQVGPLKWLAEKSALVHLMYKSTGGGAATGQTTVQAPPTSEGYSTAHMERLDGYFNNQLAMSYLSEGAGATFVQVLQPYLSLKHKTLGDSDQEVVKATERSLLVWMDDVYPVLRSRFQKLAAERPAFHFVDLSLMFTHEQVFADLAHMKYESLEWSTGNELMAARMADAIVKVMYPGRDLPFKAAHLEATPHDWKERAYLDDNPDVSALIAEGKFRNGFEHYKAVGFLEFRRSGYPGWNEKAYLADNPDVAVLIKQGDFASGYEHYIKAGKAEGRRKGLLMRWIEETYLAANPDVAAAVTAGTFKSGEDHYIRVGAAEDRKGGFSGWDEEGYLIQYGDVRNAVISKMFRSGIQHYLLAGAREGRKVSLGLTTLH